MRLHVSLDDELVRELDRRVGPRRRSAYIAAAVRAALDDARRRELIEASTETIPDTGHDWDDDPAESVRRPALRGPHSRRLIAGSRLRAVVQRVSEARVVVDDQTVGEIGARHLRPARGGTRGRRAAAERLAGKVARLRIFENDEGKFDRALLDTGGAALVVSQFTLIADTRKGNRPNFSDVRARAGRAALRALLPALRRLGVPVARGVFGARMRLELVNDGPVTIVLDV